MLNAGDDDARETYIDSLFILVLFLFVSCVNLVNYRLTYVKRTNSHKKLTEDLEFNSEVIQNIIYERTNITDA